MNLNVILLQVTTYHEYHAESFIKQPWNAFSSLVFFIPIIYWIWKLKPNFRQYPIITAILPLLFLNGVGSTLFHALEPSFALSLLDGIPPLVMVILLSSYFWTKTTHSWLYGVLIVLGCYGLNVLMAYLLYLNGRFDAATNVTYFITGMILLLPVMLILAKTNWQNWKQVALAVVLLNVALLFRVLDAYDASINPLANLLPQGTHFLWHVASAAAVFPLGKFLIHLQHTNTKDKKQEQPQEVYA